MTTSPSSRDPLPDRILLALLEAPRPLQVHELADRVYQPRRGGEWSQARRDEAVDRALRLALVPRGLVVPAVLTLHVPGGRPPEAYQLNGTGRHVAGKVLTRNRRRLERQARRS